MHYLLFRLRPAIRGSGGLQNLEASMTGLRVIQQKGEIGATIAEAQILLRVAS
jgi:hypothetical protein